MIDTLEDYVASIVPFVVHIVACEFSVHRHRIARYFRVNECVYGIIITRDKSIETPSIPITYFDDASEIDMWHEGLNEWFMKNERPSGTNLVAKFIEEMNIRECAIVAFNGRPPWACSDEMLHIRASQKSHGDHGTVYFEYIFSVYISRMIVYSHYGDTFHDVLQDSDGLYYSWKDIHDLHMWYGHIYDLPIVYTNHNDYYVSARYLPEGRKSCRFMLGSIYRALHTRRQMCDYILDLTRREQWMAEPDIATADVFALIVMHCDGYLQYATISSHGDAYITL